ncbi:preprotein translocase subunit SecE [Candidatus Saccharibacteria bacterium]|nr:preprotein translocase subunit SecE [Candidatus Saccharibacteria bacterium]
MAKITRIKASDDSSKKEEPSEPTITRKKVVVKDKKLEKINRKDAKKAEKLAKKQSSSKERKPFILIRPFVYLGRYLRDSWRELRQVRWPNRKATWKMVLAVIIYTALFMIIITLLDMFFSWIFSLLLSK